MPMIACVTSHVFRQQIWVSEKQNTIIEVGFLAKFRLISYLVRMVGIQSELNTISKKIHITLARITGLTFDFVIVDSNTGYGLEQESQGVWGVLKAKSHVSVIFAGILTRMGEIRGC